MHIPLRRVLFGAGILAVAVPLAIILVLPLLPDHSRNIPAEARGRFAGRWVLESTPSPELAAGRKTLVIESHPPHLGTGRSYLVKWDGVSIPARSQLRPPIPGKRCGVFLTYDELPPEYGVASQEGFYVNLFTDGSPDDDVEDDFLFVDLRPEDQVTPEGFVAYADTCLLYVRAD